MDISMTVFYNIYTTSNKAARDVQIPRDQLTLAWNLGTFKLLVSHSNQNKKFLTFETHY